MKNTSSFSLLSLIVLGVLCIGRQTVQGKTLRNGTSVSDQASQSDGESRNFGGTAKFQSAGWNVWDRPEDQIAIESAFSGAPGNIGARKGKHSQKNSTIAKVGYGRPEDRVAHDGPAQVR
jgi:hypothetical protein